MVRLRKPKKEDRKMKGEGTMNGFSLRGIKWMMFFCLIFLFFQAGCTKESQKKEVSQVNVGNSDNSQALDLNIENLISSEYETLSLKPLPFPAEGSRIKISGNFDFMMREAPVLDPEDPGFHEGNACEWHKQMAGMFMVSSMIASPDFTQLMKDLASATTSQIAIGNLLEKMIKSNSVTSDQAHITLNNARTILQRIRDFEPKTNGDKFLKPFLVKHLSDQIRIATIILAMREKTTLVKGNRLPEQLKDLASLMRKWADEVKLLIFQPSMSPDCVKMRKALWIALNKQAARIEYVLNGDAEKAIPLLEKMGADKEAGAALSSEKRPGEKQMEAFGEALRTADLEQIKRMVKKYPAFLKVNVSAEMDGITYSATPLHLAISLGNKEIAEFFVDQGINIDTLDSKGQSPLHVAVMLGNKDIIKMLIAKGADVNSKDATGKTPIFAAVIGGNIDLLELLVAKGADINTRDNVGSSPFDMAVIGGNRNAIEFLLANGIDVNSKDKDGGTPLHSAAFNGHKEIVELFLNKGADINAKSPPNNTTPLHLAAARGHFEVVKLLLTRGADINTRDKNGYTPLVYAKTYDHLEIAKFFQEHGGKE